MTESILRKSGAERRRLLHKVVFALISLGVTVGIMGYLLRRHPPAKILRIILDMDRRALLCFVICSFAQVFFRTWRYQLLLREVGEYVGNFAMLLTTLIRNLFSDLLPARIGTLAYIWVTTQRLGVPFESATSSFTLVFLFDMIAMAPLVLIAVFLLGASSMPTGALAVTALVMFALLVAVLWALPWCLDFVGKFLGRFKQPSMHEFGRHIRDAGRQVRETRNGGMYARLMTLSLLVRITKYAAMYFLFYAMLRDYGYELRNLPASKVFIGISAAELAASTPVSGIAAFGAYEGAWAASFSLLGFPRYLAEKTAIAGHVFTQAWGYGLGALALILILMPFLKSGKRTGPNNARHRSSAFSFTAGIIISVAVIAVAVSGVLMSEEMMRPKQAAADKPSPEEIQARFEIASELKGIIIFDSNRSGTFGIYTMNPDGTDLKALVDTKMEEQFPSASPDGKWVAFARSKSIARRAQSDIWVIRSDGTGERKIVENGTFPSWSKDGRKIYFERERKMLMAVDIESRDVSELLPKHAPETGQYELVKPRVSDDGEWAAFITNRPSQWNVWVANLKTGETRRVGQGCEPEWIPDKQSLVWISGHPPDTSIWHYEITTGRKNLVQDLKEPRSLEYFPSVSPDSKYVLFSAAPGGPSEHESANYQLFIKPFDGRKAVRLTFDAYTNRWSSLLVGE